MIIKVAKHKLQDVIGCWDEEETGPLRKLIDEHERKEQYCRLLISDPEFGTELGESVSDPTDGVNCKSAGLSCAAASQASYYYI